MNITPHFNTLYYDDCLDIMAEFDDTWQWNTEAAERVKRVKAAFANPASKVIEAFEICIPASEMLSYTSYMAERLF